MKANKIATSVSMWGVFLAICWSIVGCVDRLNARETDAGEAKRAAGADDGMAQEDRADHEQLRALRETLVKAVNEKAVDTMLSLLHENVVLTAQDGEDLAVIQGREGVRDYMERLLTGPKRGIDSLKINPTVDELTILYHGDAGIAFGSSLDHYRLVNGNEFDLKTRWSATVVKEGDQWLVANLHVSTNLFENPVVMMISRTATWIAVAAGLGGLVLGMVVTRLFRGRARV